MNPKRRCAPPRAVLASFVIPSLLATAIAAQGEADATPAKQDEPAAKAHVLPEWMVPAPGGSFDIGLTADQLLEIEGAMHRTDRQRIRDIPKLMAELGQLRGVEVEPFLLSKYPITNAQYRVFVEQTGHRFPFHWWKDGEPQHFQSTLKTIKAENSDPQTYWQQNWKELPWKIPSDKPPGGTEMPMDDYPVVYVSWADATAYAAWAGMRLPTETEWTWAALGDKSQQFVWGDDPDASKSANIKRGTRHDRIWPVGHWAEGTEGPFGHGDMVLGIWEWTGNLGYFPLGENKLFKRERDKLLKDKLLRDESDSDIKHVRKHYPEWRGDSISVKGGMWSSMKSEMRAGLRVGLESIQTLSAVGFRVAKGNTPGRDTSDSWIKGDYDMSFFGGGGHRKPNVDDQVGIERYLLGEEDAIEGYYTISFVPVNYMADSKSKLDLGKLTLQSVNENKPLVIGTLITTIELADPVVDRGIYTLCWRANGMPAGLEKQLKLARKALKTAKKDEPVERGEWAKMLSKYGITDEEAMEGKVDFIRLNPGGLKVPTEHNTYLLRDAQGQYIRAFKATGGLAARKDYERAEIIVSEHRQGGERVRVKFGVPRDEKAMAKAKSKGKASVYEFTLDLRVPEESAGGPNWRMPLPEDSTKKKSSKKK